MRMYICIYHVIFSFFLFFSSFLLLLKRRKECISTDAEKVFDKTLHAFIIFKNTKKPLIRKTFSFCTEKQKTRRSMVPTL